MDILFTHRPFALKVGNNLKCTKKFISDMQAKQILTHFFFSNCFPLTPRVLLNGKHLLPHLPFLLSHKPLLLQTIHCYVPGEAAHSAGVSG